MIQLIKFISLFLLITSCEQQNKEDKQENHAPKNHQDIIIESDKWGLRIPCYALNISAVKTKEEAQKKVDKLKTEWFDGAGYFWIPDYNSLSGAEYYSVFVKSFQNINECANYVEEYRKNNPKAYATLISNENKRVEIRGVSQIKTKDNTYTDKKHFSINRQ